MSRLSHPRPKSRADNFLATDHPQSSALTPRPPKVDMTKLIDRYLGYGCSRRPTHSLLAFQSALEHIQTTQSCVSCNISRNGELSSCYTQRSISMPIFRVNHLSSAPVVSFRFQNGFTLAHCEITETPPALRHFDVLPPV